MQRKWNRKPLEEGLTTPAQVRPAIEIVPANNTTIEAPIVSMTIYIPREHPKLPVPSPS